MKCDCGINGCQSKYLNVEKRISRMPRVLLVVVMRYFSDSLGAAHKRNDMVDVPMTLDMGEFSSGRETILPVPWVSETCVRVAPPIRKDPDNKRPLDDLETDQPPSKRSRLENPSTRTRRNPTVRKPQTRDLASEQRRLQEICGGGPQDYGLLVALFESLQLANKQTRQDDMKEPDTADPANFVPLSENIPEIRYELRGAVLHHGESTTSGHYTARVLNKGVWQIHNDDMVTTLDSQRDVIFGDDDCASVYMMFFELED